MKRFEVLNRATPILRSYFLEASAGTGKTFAIEHIAVRALLEAKEPLTLEHILIVTFTRAAARELKMRLRSNLVKVAHSLQNSLMSFDYLQPIFDAGPAAMFSALRKIEDALCNFEKAQIFTLHGFCHKMLKEGAFEAGLSFDLEPESSSYREALLQTIQDFFRVGLSAYGISQIEGVLKKYKQSIDTLCGKIIKSVERGVEIQPLPSFLDTYLEFQEKTKKYCAGIESEKLLEDFQKLAPCYKKMGGADKERQVQSFGALLEKKSPEEWDRLLGEEDHFLLLMQRENMKVRSKLPDPSSLHYPGLFDVLHRELAPLIESASSPEKNFLRMVYDCMERWEASADFEKSFAPDEILKKMAAALEKREFIQRISAKYRVAIIDEFQDTDPLQWQIFRTLFLSSPKKMLAVYLVGDPKQSIYAFRNADVYTYLEAVKILGEENRVFLDTNYRADPALVHALNTLFTDRIAKKWMQLPTQDDFLEVREVQFKEALQEEDKNATRGRVHFFIASAYSGRTKQWPTQEIEEEKFFPFLASEIKDLQKTQKLRFGQFAILVKDRYQTRRIQSFFKSCDIPCSIKKNMELEDSGAYLALYDLLQAAVSPDDLSALKKVLGGSLIGLSAHKIEGHMDKEIFQQARVYFLKARGLIQSKGWGAFFQDFLSSSWDGDQRSVLEGLLSRSDPSLYFELRQLFQILLEEVGQKSHSVEDLFAFLEQLSTLDSENEKLKISPEEEEDQVIVMTIHASKGLEFEVVFAIGLCSRHMGQEDYVRTKVAGKEWLELWDPSNEACMQASLEGDAEKMRHLYVALTRAKRRVYVPVALDRDQRPLKRGEASAIELLCHSFAREEFSLKQAYDEIHTYREDSLVEHLEILKQKCALSYTLLDREVFSIASLEDKRAPVLSFAEPPVLQGKKEFLLSFTSLSKKTEQEIDAVEEMIETEAKTSYTLPMGASTGTLLHRLLEILFKEELHHPFQEKPIASLVHDLAKESFLQGWEDVLFDIVKQTLHLPLLPGRGGFCLKDIALKQFALEMEFVFPCSQHLIKGFVDAIFKKGDKYYIIDWKSNFLGSKEEDYSREKMERAMQQHQYFLQAAIYAEALKRYIKLFEKRSFEECFGGVFYLFLRGNGVYHFYPDPSLLEQYDLGVEKLWQQ